MAKVVKVGLGVCGAIVLAALLLVVLATAGSVEYRSLGTSGVLLPGIADTTDVVPVGHANGTGYVLTWTEEDSVQVRIQTSIDGATTWRNFTALATIDGGTTGPFWTARAIQYQDAAAALSSGGFSNLPIGTHARAIVTNAGSDTVSALGIAFTLNY